MRYTCHMTAVSITLKAQLLSLFASCCFDRSLLSRLNHIRIISAEQSIGLLQQFTQCLQVPASSKTGLWALCLQVPASSKTGLWAFYLMSASPSLQQDWPLGILVTFLFSCLTCPMQNSRHLSGFGFLGFGI